MSTFLPVFILLLLFHSLPSTTGKHYPVLPIANKSNTSNRVQTYIIHVVPPPCLPPFSHSHTLERWYKSFLPSHPLDSGEPRLLYSYHHAISGFAARLTEAELTAMSIIDGFMSVQPDQLLTLQTTHTPDFLGLHHNAPGFWRDTNYGWGVIIGIVDSGIIPTHPSFDSSRMPRPPSKWKGRCQLPPPGCNNTIIGAISLISGLNAMRGGQIGRAPLPPIDDMGHGTHTAGTAAGDFVYSPGVYNNAKGVAAGIAPNAHLAIYKVCFNNTCTASDTLAGIDAAINDGVDVISISIGQAPGSNPLPLYNDNNAIGAFAAMEKGIFVSFSAGNGGPFPETAVNGAPWVLTVGASTTDRTIRTTVRLGNGQEYNGECLYQTNTFPPDMLPLVYFVENSAGRICENFTGLDVKGKVVLCESGNITGVEKGKSVSAAGGTAMILFNTAGYGYSVTADPYPLPASKVSSVDGDAIKLYIKSNSTPTAAIVFKGTVLRVTPAPMVAHFSSRGPCTLVQDIIKPDIIGPGVDILAAWPFQIGPPGGSSTFDVKSGTSMSAPHLSGIAALLRSVHREWSPAAIKSAIMTTSYLMANDGTPIPDQLLKPASFFAMGAGHVNASSADNPGLVYDIGPENYIVFLCSRFTETQVRTITRRPVIDCSNYLKADLNYPTFMVSFEHEKPSTQEVQRTVTNVGSPNSTYKVKIQAPPRVSVTVQPDKLSLSEINEKQQFMVRFGYNESRDPGERYSEGSLMWVSLDESIVVRSPIMVDLRRFGAESVLSRSQCYIDNAT